MALLDILPQNPLYVLLGVLVGVPVYHVLVWLYDPYGIRDISGPRIAALSDAWLGYWAAQGCRSEKVHEMHLKYGT